MVKARRSIFSTIFSLFINIFLFIFQFVLVYLLIDHYGLAFSGFTRLNISLLAFVGSTDGGIGIMTVLFLIKPMFENDYYRVNDILLTAKKSYQKAFFITLILIVVITLVLTFYYNILASNPIDITGYGRLSIFEMIIVILSIASKNLMSLLWIAPYENLLQADQNNYINRLVSLITDLLFYSLLFYMIINVNNPVYVFLIYIFYSLVKSVLIKIYVKIKYPWINLKKAELEDRLLLHTQHITLYKISVSFFYNLDIVFAFVLISTGSVSFISLYLIVASAFRNVTNSLIYSLKEYFGAISNKEGRVYWKDFQKLERYTIWSAGIVFVIQFLLTPYIVIALFGSLVQGLNNLSPADTSLMNEMFTNQTFATITALQTFIFLLSQPHNIMIYSKKFFSRVSFTTFIMSITAIVVSFIIGASYRFTGQDYASILYSFSISFVCFMFLHYIYLYYFSWSKLTYNSNIKDVLINIPLIISPIILAALFKIFYLNTNDIWKLSFVDKENPIYWQSWDHFINLIAISILYSLITVSTVILFLLPKWFIELIKTSILWRIFNFKHKKETKKNKNDIFLYDIDGVYYKINTPEKDLILTNKKEKEVYVLEGKKER